MPNYDYYCTHCEHKEEIMQKMTDAPLKECPACQQLTFQRKVGMGLGLHFQGSGFYCTDYQGKPTSASNSEKTGDSPSSSTSNNCGCGKSACSK